MGVDDRRRTRDHDRLVEAGELEFRIDRRGESEADLDAGALERREAADLEQQAVFAGGSAGSRKEPSSPVTAVRVPMSAGLDTVTLTPGSTPPVLSTTRPVMAPLVDVTLWAAAGPTPPIEVMQTTATTTKTRPMTSCSS